MRFCYTDFAFPVLDYFSVIKKREIVFEWGIPLIIATCAYLYGKNNVCVDSLKLFISSLISMFAIIVGFTIAAIAIFTTADQAKIEMLAKKRPDRKIMETEITNFRFVYINLIFSVIIGIIMLIATQISLLVLSSIPNEIILFILIFGSLLNILLTIRNTTNLYLIFFRQ